MNVTHFRTMCKKVKCAKANCAYPIIDVNNQCCLTCPPNSDPLRPPFLNATLPPSPPSCDNSTKCPDTFCPLPIIRCDCCKTCKQDCRVILCPKPSCRNPVIPPGECCGKCETDCRLVDCADLECPPANWTYKPGACCPSCKELNVTSNDTNRPNVSCPDHFCPNPIDCNGCKTCRQDCRAVSCIVPPCPNPIVAPGECCGTCERDCRTVRCGRPLCVNPTYKPGACCPSCEDDVCKFRGCVVNASAGIWKPDHCTTCRCASNGTAISCVGTPCGVFNCSGRRLRTVPGNCCPTCDYGIPDRKCGVVPHKKRSIIVRRGSKLITTTIILHKCDKSFIKKRNKILSCVPKYGKRIKQGQPNIKYWDVIRCRPIHWSATCELFVQ